MLPKNPIQVLSHPTHKLPTHNFVVRAWKTEKVRESGERRILKDGKSREQGGRQRKPEISRTERQLDSSMSFLGDSFSLVEGKQHTKMWLC